MTILSRVTGGVTRASAGGAITPGVSAHGFKLRIGFSTTRQSGQLSADVGCVVLLAIAVLVQGVVVALGLPHRVELLADLAALVLLAWTLIVAARGGATITVPYLAIAFAVLLVIAALRSDDVMRFVVSARNFVLLPTLALALAALGARESRNRAVASTVIGLAVLEFALTIVQALTVGNHDLVVGTFGDYSGPSTAFAILAGACLALGMYAARVGRAWWLAVAIVLPVFSIWASIRAVVPIAPCAAAAVAIAAWWAARAGPDRRTRRRRPLALGVAVLLCGVAVIGGYAIARPKDFALFTNPSERQAYLNNSTIYSYSGQWISLNAKTIDAHGRVFGGRGSLSVVPFDGVSYAGGRAEGAAPLRAGRRYSFTADVRTSVAGNYQFWASAYPDQDPQRGPVVRLHADQWTPMRVRGVKVTTGGPLFLALYKPSGTYTGSESISFRCVTGAKGADASGRSGDEHPSCAADQGQSGPSSAPSVSENASRKPKSDGGRTAFAIPGRAEQYKTAVRLIDGSPMSFLLGNGLGATTYAENLGIEKPPRAELSAGYSDFGTVLVELGWLGILLTGACALALGFGSLAAARRAEPGTWTQALLIAYPGILVTMGALAFVGTPFRNVGSATIFWVLTGLVLASQLNRSVRGRGNSYRATTPEAPSSIRRRSS
jgi:hypothetical protein